jgi:hypothetical protein
VRLILKKEAPPPWFVSEIQINEESQYVVLDDDQNIHDMWKKSYPSGHATKY